jgi:hypothetical protein
MIDLGYNESPRTVLWDEPEYTASYHTVDLGEGRVMTFFHLDVYFLNHKILQQMQEQWRLFRETVPCVLFTLPDDGSPAWERLVEMFGFQYLRDVGCTDGNTRKLYVNYGPTQEAPQEQ